MPAGYVRDEALKRITTLEKPPYLPDPASATAWVPLAETSLRSAVSYPDALMKTLIGIGCAAEGAPYVISGLIRQLGDRFSQQPAQQAGVAKAFIDERNCAGARGLSAADKASLQQIIDAAPKPSPDAPQAVGSK
jgi:hypothetical protein